MVSPGLVSPQASFLGLHKASFLWCAWPFCCLRALHLRKTPVILDEGLALTASINLLYFPQVPVSKRPSRYGLGLQHKNFGGRQFST